MSKIQINNQVHWKKSLDKLVPMLFYGFSSGIPIILIFGTLGMWLQEAGLTKSTITVFSWAALGYAFKFIWAPLIDKLPIPFLTKKLGRRRAWILTSQLSIITAIVWMSTVDPQAGESSLITLAMGAVLLGFSSATQDIVIDAYRIESSDKDLQALMSSTYVGGYRIGMLVAGAGSLYLASFLGSTAESYSLSAWSNTYLIMAAIMLIGIITTLVTKEPEHNKDSKYAYKTKDYLEFLVLFILSIAGFIAVFWYSHGLASNYKAILKDLFDNRHLASFIVELIRLSVGIVVMSTIAIFSFKNRLVNRDMVTEAYIAPTADFFKRYGVKISIMLLALIGLYRISDIVLGVIANIFYKDVGFTKIEIANVAKTFGLWVSIAGTFIGGFLAIYLGVMRVLLLGAILTVATNLLFILLAQQGAEIWLLVLVISADNLTAGIATAAFIAFLSNLTNVQFTATQYAIFSSLMLLIPKIIGGYSGTIVDDFGYENFFIFASLLGVPTIFLVIYASKHLNFKK